RLADISTSTIAVAHIRALTTAPRIKPTSIFLRSARRLNPGRGSTYRRGIFVQTTGTSSETVLGVLKLKNHKQRVKIREVLPALTAQIFAEPCRWLARNLP